jgi:maltose O-acetyltransferase
VARAAALCDRYNSTPSTDQAALDGVLAELLGEVGEDVVVKPPLRCDYGYRTSIGDRTFVNWECTLLDGGGIEIGSHCQIAPGVQLTTATHPLDPGPRREGWESAAPISIADNVWLGAGAIVCPGVSIGEDTVVGAGAVVVRDLPAGVVAVGVPARVVRRL